MTDNVPAHLAVQVHQCNNQHLMHDLALSVASAAAFAPKLYARPMVSTVLMPLLRSMPRVSPAMGGHSSGGLQPCSTGTRNCHPPLQSLPRMLLLSQAYHPQTHGKLLDILGSGVVIVAGAFTNGLSPLLLGWVGGLTSADTAEDVQASAHAGSAGSGLGRGKSGVEM